MSNWETVRKEFLNYFSCKESPSPLNKQGCRVLFEGFLRRKIVIDLDRCYSHGIDQERRCDYLVFAEQEVDGRSIELIVAILELSNQGLSAGKVVPQLRAGASIAEGALEAILSKVDDRYTNIRLFPIAVVRKGSKREETQRLRRVEMIRLNAGKFKREGRISVGKCEGRLIGMCQKS